MKCKIECVITHSTMRGEKAGAEIGAMASDLTIRGPVLVDDLAGLFSTPASFQQLLAGLYREDDALATTDLEKLVMRTEFDGVHATIGSAIATEAASHKFPKSRLKAIEFSPKAGREIEFKATLQVYPTDEQWAFIAHLREKTIRLSLSGGVPVKDKDAQQAALSLAGGKDAPKAADTPTAH